MKYYRVTNILNTNAQYNILVGERSNGKSYAVKEFCLQDAMRELEIHTDEDGNEITYDFKFIYLRRYSEDIKMRNVLEYLNDVPVAKITNGDCDSMALHNGVIYFARTNADGVRIKVREAGIICSLNQAERYKSAIARGKYSNIIYEEFITKGIYLDDEPKELQQFVSTVAGDRQIKVWLIGNTLSRVCPYFEAWQLEKTLKQKQGTIELYHHYNEDGSKIDIAVEYCESVKKKNSMFFGAAAKQIVSGEWDTEEVPKLPRKLNEYHKSYELLLEYGSFSFVLELLIEPRSSSRLVFVYPFTGSREIKRRISEKFSESIWITPGFDLRRPPECLMKELINLGKVAFSDNLTGADFTHVIQNMKI